jgi:hypothetical protein
MARTVRVRAQPSIAVAARVAACVAAWLAAGFAFGGGGAAHAQAGAEADAVPLLAEPIAYTDVIDAVEELDPLDVNVGLRYVRTDSSATIARELVDADDQRTRRVDVATHELQRNDLALELDLGIYRDVMLTFRLPIMLGEQQQLRPLSGNACAGGNSSDACVALREPNGLGTPLLDLEEPIVSARRSGLPSLELGLAWAVLNQWRSPELPTWVLRVVTSIDTGALRTACTDGPGCDPGISRGTHQLTFETRVSRRTRYVEPYLGLSHALEWVGAGEDLFYPQEERDSVVRAEPPSTTEATLGLAVIPWEDRTRQQRFEVDVQGRAATRSAGQDMSELFDALGSSQSPYLASAGFSGVTQVEAHGRLGLDLRLLLHAARYVRFALGAGFTHVTPHLITGASPCNAEVAPRPNAPRLGLCRRGVMNPLYRAVIDAPGQRFSVREVLAIELQAGATGRF